MLLKSVCACSLFIATRTGRPETCILITSLVRVKTVIIQRTPDLQICSCNCTETLIQDVCLPVQLRNIGRRKPTRCYTVFYWTCNMLNMFQACLCPSSGARDCTETLIQDVCLPLLLRNIGGRKPTRCYIVFYWTCNLLNMFRTCLCPSSGARDCPETLIQDVCLPVHLRNIGRRKPLIQDVCLPVQLRNIGRRKPTRCYTVFYWTCNMLNMFQPYLCPSSGTRDCTETLTQDMCLPFFFVI